MTRRLGIAVAVLALGACSSVRPVSDPMEYITAHRPAVVYVTYVANGVGFTREMANPRVASDSLYGTWTADNRPAALAAPNVHAVAAMRRDGGRTVLLVAGLAGVSAIVGYVMFGTANGKNDWGCDYSPNRRGPAGEPYCGPTSTL
jgi:hypothetical protein